MLTMASKVMRGIMEMLRMPMMQTPFSILAIRLAADWLVEVSRLHLVEDLQDEVKNDDNGVETEHAERIEAVQFRFEAFLGTATNDVLRMVRVPSKYCWMRS